MELTMYNETTIRDYGSGLAKVRISLHGKITFNHRAVQVLGLELGNKINFVQDKNMQSDWYIEKTTSINGFELKKSSTHGIGIYSMTLARIFLNSVTDDITKSCSFVVSPIKTDGQYYAILTHVLQKKVE